MDDTDYGVSSFAPLSNSYQPSPWTPYPGAPGGVFGQLGLQGFGEPFMRRAGMVPMGIGPNSQINPVTRFERMREQRMNLWTMQQAGKQTAPNVYNGLRGMANLAGVQWGEEQEKFAKQMSDTMATAAPYAEPMFENLAEQFGGKRGAATNLQRYINSAGKSRLDPLTGRTGLSGNSALRIQEHLYNNTLGTEGWHGIGAQTMGQSIDEFTRRGMMGSGNKEELARSTLREMENVGLNGAIKAPGSMSRYQNALQAAGIDKNKKVSDLDTNELDALGTQDAVKTGIRDMDAERIKKQLGKYKDTIKAMKDIFGENGKPGAPVPELINALQQMTNGGMSQLAPGRLNMMVRTMHNVSKASGIDTATMINMNQANSQMGARLGLDPIIASQVTTSSMAFDLAGRQTGINDKPTWGLSSADKMTGMDAKLRLGAAASPLSNQLAVLARLRESGTKFNGKASQMLKNLDNGVATGDMNMSQAEFNKMIERDSSGVVSAGRASSMLRDKDVNQEFISKKNTQDVVRSLQGAEMRKYMSDRMAFSFQGVSRLGKVDGLEGALSTAMTGMSREVANDRKARNKVIADVLKSKASGNKEVQERLKGKTAEEQEAFWLAEAEAGFGMADRDSRKKYGMSGVDVVTMTDKDVIAQTNKNKAEASIKAAIQDSMSGTSEGTPLSRFMDEISKNNDNDPESMKKALGAALGGTDKEELRKKLQSGLDRLKPMKDEIAKLTTEWEKKIGSAGTEEERDQLEAEKKREIDPRRKALEDVQTEVEKSAGAEFAAVAAEQEKAAKLADGSLTEITGEIILIDEDGERRPATINGNMGSRNGTPQGGS